MMSAIVVVGPETITIRGHQVRECLRRARIRPIYVHGCDVQGWVLDRSRLGDAMAALERNGYDVRLEGDLDEPGGVALATPPVPVPPVTEDGLW